jgi:hypothetical protein
MFDVLLMNRTGNPTVLVSGLKRESAVDIARTEARRRRVGRMFLAGSEVAPGEQVVIVESVREAV